MNHIRSIIIDDPSDIVLSAEEGNQAADFTGRLDEPDRFKKGGICPRIPSWPQIAADGWSVTTMTTTKKRRRLPWRVGPLKPTPKEVYG